MNRESPEHVGVFRVNGRSLRVWDYAILRRSHQQIMQGFWAFFAEPADCERIYSHESPKGRFLRHRPERSEQRLNYEKLYQGQPAWPNAERVPKLAIEGVGILEKK